MKTLITTPRRALPFAEVIASDSPSEATMRTINTLARRTLTPEDVHVRRALSVHDSVDHYWSAFTPDSIRELVGFAYDTPMIDGHNDGMVPFARFYAGEVVKREPPALRLVDGVGTGTWGGFDFYWPRAHSRASDLAIEFDSGITRETSARWQFTEPTCQICRGDLRECDHMPGREYSGRICWYTMTGVKRLLEISRVFRGGQQETAIQLTRAVDATLTPEQAVDRFVKETGARMGEEEHDGLVQFARCYDTRKLSKRERGSTSWWEGLRARPRPKPKPGCKPKLERFRTTK